MIYSLSGILRAKREGCAILDVHGVGLRIAASKRTIGRLGSSGSDTLLFTHLHVRDDALELYGFVSEEELGFFELLLSVSGVGPKSALAVMDVEELPRLKAAIYEGRPDLLTRASGIGRKTAERVILELRGKVGAASSEKIVSQMEGDSDLVDVLVNLGYKRTDAKEAVAKIGTETTSLNSRLKAALGVLGRGNNEIKNR